MNSIDPQLAREAKAIVALAFRNGPIEDIHAGKPCPTCRSRQGYSRLTDADVKLIMQNAVDHVYKLLWLRESKPQECEAEITFAESYTTSWDDPRIASVSK
jgi:hypothetical protein